MKGSDEEAGKKTGIKDRERERVSMREGEVDQMKDSRIESEFKLVWKRKSVEESENKEKREKEWNEEGNKEDNREWELA